MNACTFSSKGGAMHKYDEVVQRGSNIIIEVVDSFTVMILQVVKNQAVWQLVQKAMRIFHRKDIHLSREAVKIVSIAPVGGLMKYTVEVNG